MVKCITKTQKNAGYQVPILVTPSPFHLIGLESDFEFDQSQDLMEETSAMFGYLWIHLVI